MSTTLTKKQIKDLAVYVGFHVQDVSDSDEDTEIVVTEGTISADDNEPEYTGLLAYNKDYPEDGAVRLE